MYEPDFVARSTDQDGQARYLVIEFKGQINNDALTKQKYIEEIWIPAVNTSSDPACAGIWRYLLFDSSDAVEDMKYKLQRIARSTWRLTDTGAIVD